MDSGKLRTKLLFLMRLLLQETDEQNALTMDQIIARMNLNGISAERKSIYDDMAALREYGLDICTQRSKSTAYFIGCRDFELPEVKLLLDSVQASRFLTEKKSKTLIAKFATLCSSHEAKTLNRQVYVTGRIKNMNESIYFNIDALHNAIARDCRVRFRYLAHILAGKKQYRRDGENYEVSPFALICDSENYYLIAYDPEAKKFKHYRVDKMEAIALVEQRRQGKTLFAKLDMAWYSSRNFSMYGGQQQEMRIRFSAHLLGPVIDRFGTNVPIEQMADTHFTARVIASVSPTFFGWLFSLDGEAVILSPTEIATQMREKLATSVGMYEI